MCTFDKMQISEISPMMQPREHLEIALCWFKNHFLKLNPDKLNLLVSEYEQVKVNLGIHNMSKCES